MKFRIILLATTVMAAAASGEIRLSEGEFVLSPAPEQHGREWRDVFAVYVETGAEVPPMSGSYRVESGALVFQPRYPLTGGMAYRAEAGGESKVFEIPAERTEPATIVEAVYPSSDELPENLLKFYIHFTAPMGRGEAYERIRLLKESGEAVEAPFLELEQELWDVEGMRFTLLFDPGRIKTDLVPNQELGMAMERGKQYVLEVDAAWRDADGLPLKETFRKRFRVTPPDDTPPETKDWNVTPPRAGTREPLVVVTTEPMDHALMERVVRVTTPSDEPVAGEVAVDREETRWRFTPDEPWRAEPYHIQADTILEDRAGNSLGKPFEVDVFEKIEDRFVGKTERLRFVPVD